MGRREPEASAGPLRLVEPPRTWDVPTANATIPPVNRTAADFEPVYLNDEQLARKERASVESGPAVAHEPIEATRR